MVAFIFIVLFIGHGSEILRGVSSDDENPRVESNYIYWKSVPLGRTRCARHNRVLVPLSSPRRTKTALIKVPFCRLGGDKVEIRGVEPLTSYMRSKRSTN